MSDIVKSAIDYLSQGYGSQVYLGNQNTNTDEKLIYLLPYEVEEGTGDFYKREPIPGTTDFNKIKYQNLEARIIGIANVYMLNLLDDKNNPKCIHILNSDMYFPIKKVLDPNGKLQVKSSTIITLFAPAVSKEVPCKIYFPYHSNEEENGLFETDKTLKSRKVIEVASKVKFHAYYKDSVSNGKRFNEKHLEILFQGEPNLEEAIEEAGGAKNLVEIMEKSKEYLRRLTNVDITEHQYKCIMNGKYKLDENSLVYEPINVTDSKQKPVLTANNTDDDIPF